MLATKKPILFTVVDVPNTKAGIFSGRVVRDHELTTVGYQQFVYGRRVSVQRESN